MILRSDRLDGMPGEAEGRWKDQEPQESQFCHLFRKIVRRRQILGLSYFGGLLWWKVAWQWPKEMPPANISFTGQSCLSQPEPDAHIQQRHHSEMRIFWGTKGSCVAPGRVLVCPDLRHLHPLHLRTKGKTLPLRTVERSAAPSPSLLNHGGPDPNHQQPKLSLPCLSTCCVQHCYPQQARHAAGWQ